MKAYLDTSVIVPLFVTDAQTARAETCLAPVEIVVSTWVQAEFASAVGVKHRMSVIDRAEVEAAQAAFDEWLTSLDAPSGVENGDLLRAERLLRRRELKLRTPDALHIAIVQRLRLPLLTFDRVMADAATALGLTLVPA